MVNKTAWWRVYCPCLRTDVKYSEEYRMHLITLAFQHSVTPKVRSPSGIHDTRGCVTLHVPQWQPAFIATRLQSIFQRQRSRSSVPYDLSIVCPSPVFQQPHGACCPYVPSWSVTVIIQCIPPFYTVFTFLNQGIQYVDTEPCHSPILILEVPNHQKR